MIDFFKDIKEEWNESNFYRKNILVLSCLFILLILFCTIGYAIISLLKGDFIPFVTVVLFCWFIFCIIKE